MCVGKTGINEDCDIVRDWKWMERKTPTEHSQCNFQMQVVVDTTHRNRNFLRSLLLSKESFLSFPTFKTAFLKKQYNTKIENSTVLIWKTPNSLKAGLGSALRGPETAGLWLSSNEGGKKYYGNREDLPWRRSLLEQPPKMLIYCIWRNRSFWIHLNIYLNIIFHFLLRAFYLLQYFPFSYFNGFFRKGWHLQ